MKTTKYFILLLAAICTLSCTKILDTDISTSTLTVLSPTNHDSSTITTKTFWWNNVDGATSYNFQFASPSFANVTTFKDTTVTKNTFAYTFPTNIPYEWRVCGKNGSSQTPYVTQSFYVKKAPLNTLAVTLLSPINSDSSTALVDFKWGPLPDAIYYSVEIDSLGLTYKTLSVKEKNNGLGQYTDTTYTLSKGNAFTWKVRAYSSSTNYSQISSTGAFSIKKK